MKKLISKILIVLLGMFMLSTDANAQFVKQAQVGMKFLSNPISAEVIARGNTGITSTFNSNGIFWNPALTSRITSNYDVSLNYHQWIADISYSALAASVNAFDFGVVTVSGMFVDYGDLTQTVRSGNEQGFEETGTFSPAAFVIGLGFAQTVTDRFSYGVNAKFINQDLGSAWISTGQHFNDSLFSLSLKSYEKNAVAFDVGAFYDFKYKGITFAATLSNIAPDKKYESDVFPLPFSVSFGATIAPTSLFIDNLGDHDIKLIVESNHPRDSGEKIKVGLEYNYMKTIYFRTGYITRQDERKFAAGLGFRKELGGVNMRIDYAFQDYGIFGNMNYFTVGVGL